MNSAEARPHLRIERLVKRFAPGAAPAVDQVSLDVAEGAFFALLGPSGCGKTTLLRLLAGFERPDEGRILIAGDDMAQVPPYRRPVNMMFQSYALFPHMSAAENIAFGLKQEKRPRRETDERVRAMLELVKLTRLAERRPSQLSGGERQRVALARALVKEPKLLLLDEPLTALDRKLREETRHELVRIQQRVGITFLMVTHDQEEAMSMATRVAVMREGRIAQIGTPHEVYESPSSRFVADFLGAVNLFTGRVAGHEGSLWRIDSDEAGATLVVAHYGALAEGSEVAVAVRPEKIALTPGNGGANARNVLAGTVESISYRGEASTYRVALPGGKLVRVTVPNRAREGGERAPGDRVTLAWDEDAALVIEAP
ncbi:MAG TPA: ABC transporter ATP-binding protein [Stellaceae bacterium]|nr:ABC transporter ATP-binding protein [Stellaceae bacterium]